MRLMALTFLLVASTVLAEPTKPKPGNLKVGDPSPDFTLKDVTGKTTVKLADLKGKPTVLIFGSCT